MNENMAEELKMKKNSVTLFWNVLTGLLFFILKIIFYSTIPLRVHPHNHCHFPKMADEGLYLRPFWLSINVLFCLFSTLQHIQGWGVVKKSKEQLQLYSQSHPFYEPYSCKRLKKVEDFVWVIMTTIMNFFGFLPLMEAPVSWLVQQNYYGLHDMYSVRLSLSIPINWINNEIFISNRLINNWMVLLQSSTKCAIQVVINLQPVI